VLDELADIGSVRRQAARSVRSARRDFDRARGAASASFLAEPHGPTMEEHVALESAVWRLVEVEAEAAAVLAAVRPSEDAAVARAALYGATKAEIARARRGRRARRQSAMRSR